jgi:putative transposase
VITETLNTITTKVKVPKELSERLNALYPLAFSTAEQMLARRGDLSSKHWKLVPCVIAKGLSRKYQCNPRCRRVKRLVIPVHGDKGRQVKLVEGGFRVPSIFKKSIVPFTPHYPLVGFIRHLEFYRRGGEWFCYVCYNTACDTQVSVSGCVGVDRNSVGNVSVLADLNSGIVRHLGFNPARTKACWRGRKKNLQRQGKRRLLSKLRKKQARRTIYENHCVSRQVVDYAKSHSRAIALEKLSGVNSEGSKIRRYSEKNQWSFAQLAKFIHYKARLAGVPVVEVDPAYTSQTCSRCGHIHKPDGKSFRCPACGHQDHRDANAAFNIAKRGWDRIGGLARDSVRPRSGLLVAPVLGSGARQ